MTSWIKKSLLVCSLLFIASCSAPDVIHEERALLHVLLKENTIKHSYLDVDEGRLHYVTNGEPKKPSLIIIHGTPGNWLQYGRYLFDPLLLEKFYVVVIDRPGWGESVLANNKKIASFKEQAKIIAGLAKQLRASSGGQAIILMGHSLGASMSPQVAIDYPELIDGLLLFSGTLDPQLSLPRWYNYLAALPFVPHFIGDGLHQANEEVFALKNNIKILMGQLETLKAQTLVVQGMEDKLVSPKNSAYARNAFNKNNTQVIELDDQGHLFPMTMRVEVAGWAIQLLSNIEQRRSYLLRAPLL